MTPAPAWGRRIGMAATALLVGAAVGRFVVAGGPADSFTTTSTATASAPSPGELIAALEARTAATPDDVQAWTELGTALVQEAVRTGDANWATAADRALARATALDPDDVATIVARGTLALTQHDFETAAALSTRARALDPYSDEALAVAFDAAIERGRYDEAATRLQDLLDLRPGLPAYARLSYWRELHGDLAGAQTALGQAETTAAGSPFDRAVIAVLRGDLAFARGDLGGAREAYEQARQRSRDAIAADVGLARVLAAEGDLDGAIGLLQARVEVVPHPAALELLGDLQAAAGDLTGARRSWDLVRTTITLQEASGAVVDLEWARFEADHGDPPRAVTLAVAAYESRPTVHTADALAWARFQAGDVGGAAALVGEALALGSVDPVVRYHAAAIAAANGRADEATAHLRLALTAHPRFLFHRHDEVAALATRLRVPIPQQGGPT